MKQITLSKQEQFIKKHRNRKSQIILSQVLILLVFLTVWEISANTGVIDSFFFSSPSRVFTLFLEMCMDHSIFIHTGITLFETLVSFLLVFLISIVIATILWYFDKLAAIAEPYLIILNSLPKSALAPLFIVWLGTGIPTIIVAGMSVALFGSILSFYTGFKQNDAEKLTLIYTLGGSKWDAYRKVILPGSVPTMLNTAKVNIGLALVGVVIGEFLAARRGLGYLIIYGSQVFQLNLVITGIVILSFIAIGLYGGIQFLSNHIQSNTK